MDFRRKTHASQPSRRGSEENRTPRENNIIKELTHQHHVIQDQLQMRIARLKQELTSKNLELSRGVPVPYGSYSSSGATPELLHSYSEKVLIDLDNFVLFSVPPETPIEFANSLKARVSKVFFSKFEQINFGVKGESLFTIPGLLPEQSLTEFTALLTYADDPEDEAVKPYVPKYKRFFEYKLAKIQKTCVPVARKDASYAHFCNLAMNVWMLHKLTFSFERANVRLMRVVRDEPFIGKFMEPVDQQDEDPLRGKPPVTTTTVKHVILPGLWINSSVIKCRVCLGSATGQEPSTAPATQFREGDPGNETVTRSVDVTPDNAHQQTSSQAPDKEAPAPHASAHAQQQAQAMECTRTDELYVSRASQSFLPDEDLGNAQTSAVEVDQAAQEMTNMDITNSPQEPASVSSVSENNVESYYSTSSAHLEHHSPRK